MNTGLVWFQNNLRSEDNLPLAKACKENDRVIAVYFYDPRQFAVTQYGFPKTGKFRAKFLMESISELKQQLSSQNIPLFIFHQKPEDRFPEFLKQYAVGCVYLQEEWTREEQMLLARLKGILPEGVRFKTYFDQFLFHPEDIPYPNFNEIPEIFTSFRKKCETKISVRECTPVPKPLKKESFHLKNETEIPDLRQLGFQEFKQDPRSAFPFKGGEKQAKKRINHYFWKTQKLAKYKQTRNGLLGEDYSSKLSPWLDNGSISSRQIYWEVQKFEKEIIQNEDTYWLIFELIWRDYFKFISLKHGNSIFKIAATGFMSNRGRQNVASYWAKELKQDWRFGAAYFESLLIDYDVHSNWGNWMYNSGVGNDPRDRKFNIKRQAERYDPNQKFQNLWLGR